MSVPEGVDLAALADYFAKHVEGASTGAELHAELISGGRSNLTYRIGDDTRHWVLRRPPLGHVLPTAHDMGREFRVISALAHTDVPVPRALALCEDDTVNGASFYVMEEVEGRILRDPSDFEGLTPADARRCSEQLVDVLARIHAVDYEDVGLGDFGRPDGYVERQLRRFAQQRARSQTRDLPGLDDLERRLNAALPRSGAATIVHGDYRLDNTMLAHDDVGRIVAVLDWEMATLGDPLADVGMFLLYWGIPDAQVVATGIALAPESGFLSSDDVVERYARITGRPVDDLDFYVALGAYKLAIIVEGIHARFLQGKTLGEGFDEMGDLVPRLIEAALDIARNSSMPALSG
ncbi:MAG: phosphotransferase family protein [Acidimicrobiia bacterium]|nr:phosphotransferase family protein [Acidimicrobiia bacterium]